MCVVVFILQVYNRTNLRPSKDCKNSFAKQGTSCFFLKFVLVMFEFNYVSYISLG
jgi:hypothetical protein